MILEFKIKNYLSFNDEVTFSFEATADKTLEDYYVVKKEDGTRILKMMMVYGANASGKSNLIIAFEFINTFIHNIPDDKDEETGFVPFLFLDTILEFGEFDLWFYVSERKYRYNLVISNKIVKSEKLYNYPGTQPALVFKREYNENTNTTVVKFGNKIKITDQASEAIQLKCLNNTSVFAAYNQVNVAISELDIVAEWFKNQYMPSINPYESLTSFSDDAIKNNNEVKEQALKFLKEADFNITDVIFEERTEEIPEFILKTIDSSPFSEEEKNRMKKEKVYHYFEKFYKHQVITDDKIKNYTLEEERQSRGTLRYYGLSAPFFYTLKNNAFLPIDEIGSALHPLLVIHFMKEFLQKSNQAQLLFTTHNLSILNEKDILRKDAIWFTEKEKDGSTNVFSMADFPIRKELSYYNAYKLGKFGAIPEFE